MSKLSQLHRIRPEHQACYYSLQLTVVDPLLLLNLIMRFIPCIGRIQFIEYTLFLPRYRSPDAFERCEVEPLWYGLWEHSPDDRCQRPVHETRDDKWMSTFFFLFFLGGNYNLWSSFIPAIMVENPRQIRNTFVVQLLQLWWCIKATQVIYLEIHSLDNITDKTCYFGVWFLTAPSQFPWHQSPDWHICPRPWRCMGARRPIAVFTAIGESIATRQVGQVQQVTDRKEGIGIVGRAMTVVSSNPKFIKCSSEWIKDMEDYSTWKRRLIYRVWEGHRWHGFWEFILIMAWQTAWSRWAHVNYSRVRLKVDRPGDDAGWVGSIAVSTGVTWVGRSSAATENGSSETSIETAADVAASMDIDYIE